MSVLSPAFAGAGLAFLLSGVLVMNPAISYSLLKLGYGLGLVDPQYAYAGSLPNPVTLSAGYFLWLLGLISLLLSALTIWKSRRKATL